MPNILFSLLPAVTAVIASFILFLRIKKNNILQARDFFWHYAFAFAIIAISSIQIVLINLGVAMSYNILLIMYAVSVFTVFFSYLLFFRGTALLFTQDRFLPTLLPLLILPVGLAFTLCAMFFMKFSTIIIYTAVAWGFLFVNDNLLSSILLYSFATGSPIKSMKGKPCALILSLGWFLVLGLDVILWISSVLYHPELWILKISSMKLWYIARAIAYLVILIGTLLSVRCLRGQGPSEKE